MTLSVQGSALQVIASTSLYNASQSRNVLVPLDTTTVRRSTRSTKYDGFKINHVSDIKRSKSRVKPRETSFITAVSLAAAPVQVRADACPPPMTIEDLQHKGSRCGIAQDVLSPEKLLDDQRSSTGAGD